MLRESRRHTACSAFEFLIVAVVGRVVKGLKIGCMVDMMQMARSPTAKEQVVNDILFC
jgi:hypothetical protein